MSLLYYVKECAVVAEQFPEIASAQVSFTVAVDLIKRLAVENGVRIIGYARTSGRRRSNWNPTARTITLNVAGNGTVGVCTAVHEFAHALDGKLRPHSARWHDLTFMSIVLDYCRIIQSRGWHKSIPTEHAAREQEATSKEREKAARTAEANRPEALRAKKIEHRKIQIARLERRLKTLQTRLRTAQRSLGALERADRRASAPVLSIVKAVMP